jgi:hypothetical protein
VLEKLRKPRNISVKVVGVPSEIQTDNLLKMRPYHFHTLNAQLRCSSEVIGVKRERERGKENEKGKNKYNKKEEKRESDGVMGRKWRKRN